MSRRQIIGVRNQGAENMWKYLNRRPKRELAPGVRLVHNFYPGPDDDPGRDREVGEGGFRIWVTDKPIEQTNERRCACGWLGREHYGTVRTWPMTMSRRQN